MLDITIRRGCGAYPWGAQLLALAPLLLLLAVLRLRFSGPDEMYAFFRAHGDGFPWVKTALAWFSDLGSAACYAVYLALAWRYVRRGDPEGMRFLLAFAVAWAISLAAVKFLKFAIGRPRPPRPWDEFQFFASEPGRDSFPSGHMSENMLAVSPLATRFGRIALPLLCGLSPAMMGLSRLYLEAHYPGDVLAGAALGSCGSLLAWRLAGRGVPAGGGG